MEMLKNLKNYNRSGIIGDSSFKVGLGIDLFHHHIRRI